MISFVVVGLSGILINVVIGKHYGSQALGVFNLIFAVYIFFSQIAVFGIHLSALKYISEHTKHQLRQTISTAALILTCAIASLVTTVALFVAPLLGTLFHSDGVMHAWQYIAIGLFFFAMNKTLFSIVNGMETMRFFAIAQALRYLFALFIVGIFLLYDIPSVKLGLIISLSETILFVILFGFVLRNIGLKTKDLKTWIRRHFLFGYHSFWGATIGELNTRVDTLTLGIFVDDAQVGVYSLALMIFEGFVQMGVVLRNVFNPQLSRLIGLNDAEQIRETIRKIKRNTYFAFTLVSFVAMAFFPFFVHLFFTDAFDKSIPIFILLMVSFIIASGYLPFDMILSQAGFPKHQSYFRTSIITVNIVLNFLLIPQFGIYGAALATLIAFVSRIYFLNKYAIRTVGIRI